MQTLKVTDVSILRKRLSIIELHCQRRHVTFVLHLKVEQLNTHLAQYTV